HSPREDPVIGAMHVACAISRLPGRPAMNTKRKSISPAGTKWHMHRTYVGILARRMRSKKAPSHCRTNAKYPQIRLFALHGGVTCRTARRGHGFGTVRMLRKRR